MKKKFLLITGRTSKQAVGMHKGKNSQAYLTAVTRADMNGEDMARLDIKDGQTVRLKITESFVDVPIFKGNLPEKMIFMPMGPVANRLIGSDTHGKGMPLFKGQKVEVEIL